jgi:formylglycine-generating enzyme required for sulfatase activity
LDGAQAQGDLVAKDAVEVRRVETKTRVFISYSRKDMAFADKLEAALKSRGFEVLIDRQEIYAFEDWWKRIEALIGSADTVVFVLSPDSVKSDVALNEITHAASLNKRFAPIVRRRVEDTAVPEALRRLNFIFFDEAERFEASANRLADALETDINWIRQHTEYGEAERRWASAGRPNGLLLQPPTLDIAEYWIASRPRNAPEPTKEIRSFVIASRKQARKSQRIWRAVLVSLFTLLLGIILSLVGWINHDYIADEWRWWITTRPYAAANVWPYVLTAVTERALNSESNEIFRECAPKQPGKDYCPDMVVIPAGSFVMGGPVQIRDQFEQPLHAVAFAQPFAISKYEVTFDEWDICVEYGDCPADVSDSNFGRGQRPAINVTWDEAQRYAAWLSKMTGKAYRLATESEYEYATRAGTETLYPWGDDIRSDNSAMANCNSCGSKWDNNTTSPVGSFPPNKFGLYDMVGNVWEWTEDCWHPNYNGATTDGSAWTTGGDCSDRVIRGGSRIDHPIMLRSVNRGGLHPGVRLNYLGFRIARTLIAP